MLSPINKTVVSHNAFHLRLRNRFLGDEKPTVAVTGSPSVSTDASVPKSRLSPNPAETARERSETERGQQRKEIPVLVVSERIRVVLNWQPGRSIDEMELRPDH